ncbi:MAG: outer membrane protein assembly factor BamE [Candidatus Latescibacteria bacterium]|nr:outer membrane protein assembly factor BamE [Candidatus Latescibacterota bacterium]
MKKTGLLILVVIITVFITSCATVGRDFPTDIVADIRIGKTTQGDINRMFGSPWRTGIEDGDKTWTYGYYKYRLLGESVTRDLVVRFDKNMVVRSYSFNTSEITE